jgi:hypothetical protein
MSPFKIQTNIDADLLKVGDTDFEEYYPRINTNTDWALLLPYINDALDMYIIPFIGEAFYTTLMERSAVEGVTASEIKALQLLKRAVAYYMAMYAYPKEQDLFSDLGVTQNSPENAHSTSVAVFKSKLWNLTLTADDHLDALLAFLEVRVKANDTRFDIFKTSTAYKNGKSDLFRDAFELQEFHNINRSRRTYLSLLPSLADAAELYIIPNIGQGLYTQVVAQFHSNTLSVANEKLLKHLRRVAVKYAIVIASDTEGLLFDNYSAVRVVSNPEGMDTREGQITARMNARKSARMTTENIANRYLSTLRDFLDAHSADYPTYAAEMITPIDNRRRNKIITSRDCDGRTVGGIML